MDTAPLIPIRILADPFPPPLRGRRRRNRSRTMRAGITAIPRLRRRTASSPAIARPVALALQGGGSLGAFTWGVLERLLDEPRLQITVVSGASAGAMNAAILTQGLAA